MRLAALLVVAIATPALAERPKPLPLPEIAVPARTRGARQVLVVGPSVPLRHQPVIDELVRAELQRRIKIGVGFERIAAVDALTASLEELDVADADLEPHMDRIRELYASVLVDPALETYLHADEMFVRAAKSVSMTDEKLAKRSFERMLARFPRSPFTYEAHLSLAAIAEGHGDFVTANRHLQAILATHTGQFARFTRLKLGWLYHDAKDPKRAVAELSRLAAERGDPLVVEAAADSLIAPYALAGRADFAATLFDRIDRTRAAERLRQLAGEYANAGKRAEEVIVLRAAIAREGDRNAICLDRADIVTAMTTMKNRSDAELAIAELAEAVRTGEPPCVAAADAAVGNLAKEWHRQRAVSTAQLARIWARAAEFASTPQRRAAAEQNRANVSASRDQPRSRRSR